MKDDLVKHTRSQFLNKNYLLSMVVWLVMVKCSGSICYNDQSETAAGTLSLASSKKHLWEKNKGFEPSASLVLKTD